MPFIPHTENDIKEMLQTIGVSRIEDLFDEIPKNLRLSQLRDIGPGMTEMELNKLMQQHAKQDGNMLCFIGAGAYEHHIPAAVWDITSRGEFMTCYTPYQAEASQGTLQLIYEFQTMMANLLDMEIANASLYDGASALGEAILMAARLYPYKKGQPTYKVLMPRTLHPNYRDAAFSIAKHQHITFIDVPYVESTGKINSESLQKLIDDHDDIIALVIPQPNYFGVLDDIDALTQLARDNHLLSIGVVNPLACALLKPPGQWGGEGVDIVCGEGQPLGIPLAAGGPYFGFMCCKKKHLRQMPGRVVGRTIDMNGKPGFVLTLQAREQHIRRAKATSNICTNQGLLVTAATIYMSLLGPAGLRQTALLCHQRTRELCDALTRIPGVNVVFNAPYFHEIVFRLPKSPNEILQALAKNNIQGGVALTDPNLKDCLLMCATETKTSQDIKTLAVHLREILAGEKLVCHA